ncbi:helix-turn-helix domain-containing protein [Panacibacter sp. DH6]|uniref:Helix-turn-helix domain-containing protein n=1 Tax=Panacibacter microcysteis TaxID=2793269 RepID=A0A931GTL9_9BACT|nr:helix-turn-helix domain-containing protein [Panacibacter microcysteis]MBG9375701.1 helix-turn-helix domain-containing protein [Panacibacter microcysteis]
MLHDDQNSLFTIAANFIQYTSRPVFLTGRAGTGKTTFLKYIQANTHKQVAVIAPTGVAAINAGGATIHSFFQLPFTPYIPESKGFQQTAGIDRHHLLGRIKMNGDRRKVLQQLELLIIDEISMVRCDVLDAIDVVLRHFRNRYSEPFGGVQLLFIGDMFQLPPVVQEDEWRILAPHYRSPFFFDSHVLMNEEPVHIELNKIYRQNEQQFIDLLNKVRNNEMDEEGFHLLNSRFNADFQPSKDAGYITLTTHNYKADAINADQLNKLSSAVVNYKAVITGEFYEKSYPADELLQLKEGAQVMMIKNDPEKKYFNGKIGVVTRLETESVFVQCKDDPAAIELRKEKWENIRYTLNASTQRVEEEVIGSFEQFPLRLAWAITIHKSQGLTFEKAIIDAGAAFASGQVYVALSRCTTLGGIVLKSRITGNGMRNDERIVQFSRQKEAAAQLNYALNESKRVYQSSVLTSVFDIDAIFKAVSVFEKFVTEEIKYFNEEVLTWLATLQERLDHIAGVLDKFKPQLQALLNEPYIPEQHEALQGRLMAASKYFAEQLQVADRYLAGSVAVTDSKQKAMVYNLLLHDVHVALSQAVHTTKGLEEGFNAASFAMHRKGFRVTQLRVNAYAVANNKTQQKTETPHPALFQQLRLLRDKIVSQKNVPVYLVASGDTLHELSTYLPQTLEELAQITGFGKAKIESYGQQFIELINAYAAERNLTSCIHEKPVVKKEKKETKPAGEKTDTKLESYKLYKAGKSIAEIAQERNLAAGTIETHLAYYIEQGELSVNELVSTEKIVLIEPVVRNMENNASAPVKQQLGDQVTYGEIKFVIASLNHLKNKEKQQL